MTNHMGSGSANPKSKIVVFGVGSFAELVHYYLSRDPNYEILAFTVDRKYLQEDSKFSLPVVPWEELTALFPKEEFQLFIAIGYNNLNRTRALKFKEAIDKDFSMISYVSPNAQIADNVTIGQNCFIFDGCTVQPFSIIGNNVIIWGGSFVGHHSIIGDHSFLGIQSVISGHVKIGSNTFIGSNATIRDGITIAKYSTIGANALIVKDNEEYGVHGGIPAKFLRKES